MQKKELIKEILERFPETRGSDTLLALKVWERENPVILSYDLGTALKNFNWFGVTNIESIGRFRRKLQNEFPELRATEGVRKARQDKEGYYLAIARG